MGPYDEWRASEEKMRSVWEGRTARGPVSISLRTRVSIAAPAIPSDWLISSLLTSNVNTSSPVVMIRMLVLSVRVIYRVTNCV